MQGYILVMDDMLGIRDVIKRGLEQVNYKVETVSDGVTAIAQYFKALEAGNRFDVVFLDLSIPGSIGGVEVLNQLILIDPEIKAILMSGTFDSESLAKYEELGFKAKLDKPFILTELWSVVQTVLQNPS